MTVPIQAIPGVVILSIEYAPNGLDWARVYDNECVGWLVDESVPATEASRETREIDPRAPSVTGFHAPYPLIVGSLAKPAPATAPIISPQWAKYTDPAVIVPDVARMRLHDFLTWLATNNGARRPVSSWFAVSSGLYNGYVTWARANPELTWGDPLT
jgi:hypothetical protein